MKNFRIIVVMMCFIGALTSCELNELDNYEGPAAGLHGQIIDSETGELIQQDIIRGSVIEIIEHGYDPVQPQYLVFKNDGTYKNTRLFANTYTVQPVRGNFIPLEPQELKLKGQTTLDFTATPYIRVRDASIVRNGDKVVATFRLEQNVLNNVKKIGLYAHPDPHVGEPMRLVAAEMELNAVADEQQVYTLEIDIPSNTSPSRFVPGRDHFFRVGALIDIGEAKPNYAPAVRIPL